MAAAVPKKQPFKLKVLSRNPEDYKRATKLDIHKAPRNPDSYLHPHSLDREYKRALNATKLERVFAKPFLCDLCGHGDTITSFGRFPTRLNHILSAAADGEVRLWDLPRRKCISSIAAHQGMVHGLCVHHSGNFFMSCGMDANLKVWGLDCYGNIDPEPKRTILHKHVYKDVDHHEKDDMFAACGQSVDLYVGERNQPVQSYKWGSDTIHFLKFNRIETHILAACSDDRGIILYDTRTKSGVSKIVMRLKTNALSWNPMQAYIFTAATDDYNCYTYDTRYLKSAQLRHEDHVSAVMDVDYAPTGKEFCTGGYDRSIRIYNSHERHSRDVYQTKRMQRINHVVWTLDNKYILSGSDEMNIRLWKARASDSLGVLKPRMKTALDTADKLKKQFKNHPEINKISSHRHLPKYIFVPQKDLKEQKHSQKKREINLRTHRKPGTVPDIPENKKQIDSVQE